MLSRERHFYENLASDSNILLKAVTLYCTRDLHISGPIWMIQFDTQDSHIKPFSVGVRFVEMGPVKVTFHLKASTKFRLYFLQVAT